MASHPRAAGVQRVPLADNGDRRHASRRDPNAADDRICGRISTRLRDASDNQSARAIAAVEETGDVPCMSVLLSDMEFSENLCRERVFLR